MRTVGEEQVLICGVITNTYQSGDVVGTEHKFLIQRGDGSFEFETIDGVLGNWRYGETGWYDLEPAGESPNPIDEGDDVD